MRIARFVQHEGIKRPGQLREGEKRTAPEPEEGMGAGREGKRDYLNPINSRLRLGRGTDLCPYNNAPRGQTGTYLRYRGPIEPGMDRKRTNFNPIMLYLYYWGRW